MIDLNTIPLLAGVLIPAFVVYIYFEHRHLKVLAEAQHRRRGFRRIN